MMRESSKNHAGIMARLGAKQKCRRQRPIARKPQGCHSDGLRDTARGLGDHPPGWKGLPREAGMLTRIQTGLREISTNTTMVAR
jgi:hypothetical protein